MSAKGKLLIILFIATGLLSAFGLYRLFALRFETGDMFPPYSSLRSDPLGCKALFLALERLPGMELARNYRDLSKMKGVKGRTIFYLGAGEALLNASADGQAEELETLAGEGNRLVIAFVAAKSRSAAATAEEDTDEEEDRTADEDEEQPAAAKGETAEPCDCKAGRWGVRSGSSDSPTSSAKGRPQATLTSTARALPPHIPLHSRRWFLANQEEWRPVYSRDTQPVVLERRIGKGSIVLMADAYLLSNEALRNDRQPQFLAWLQGIHRAALFDESHLGVYDNPGVITLISKHRLVPFLIALMALAVLYVWKSAVPFVNTPVQDSMLREENVRDNFSGLVNLLRRNIAQADLLNACFREWSSSFAREIKRSPELSRQLLAIKADETARPVGKRDPLAHYREIQGRLKGEGRRFRV